VLLPLLRQSGDPLVVAGTPACRFSAQPP
jgi:hypothetical protein